MAKPCGRLRSAPARARGAGGAAMELARGMHDARRGPKISMRGLELRQAIMTDTITLRHHDGPDEAPMIVHSKQVSYRGQDPSYNQGQVTIHAQSMHVDGLPIDFDINKNWSQVGHNGREWLIKNTQQIGNIRITGSIGLNFVLEKEIR